MWLKEWDDHLTESEKEYLELARKQGDPRRRIDAESQLREKVQKRLLEGKKAFYNAFLVKEYGGTQKLVVDERPFRTPELARGEGTNPLGYLSKAMFSGATISYHDCVEAHTPEEAQEILDATVRRVAMYWRWAFLAAGIGVVILIFG